MILMAMAAATLLQWTGPRTVEYVGPGYYCGGGYRVMLAPGDRALVLPQGQAPQATRLVLGGREVNITTGAAPEPGKVVMRDGASAVTEHKVGAGVNYMVSDDTPYGLRVASGSFRGFTRDRWFFTKTVFDDGGDENDCLSARSH
jgi:carbohydrate-binding DOMON domain-containing protein